MLCAKLYNRQCTLRYWSAGPPDDHNDPTDVFTEVDTLCLFQGRSRLQSPGDGQIGVTMWFVFLKPSEIVPKSADRIVVDGTEYNFHGDGWLAHDESGQPDHIELSAWRAA
jgi:hypothetical protein